MTLDELHALWDIDHQIDKTALDEEARRVPYLHAKWWRIYTRERLAYRSLTAQHKVLYRARWEYFAGKLDDTERLTRGWPPLNIKVLSANLSIYLDGDDVLQADSAKCIMAEEKLRFVEDVIKSINNRGYTIKNVLDFIRFSQGD
jgi:hypothetical protein